LATKDVVDKFGGNGLARAAATLGFDGALIERQPYTESEWLVIDKDLSASSCKIYEDSFRSLFSFKPCQNDQRS
jgi:hypothetical protein